MIPVHENRSKEGNFVWNEHLQVTVICKVILRLSSLSFELCHELRVNKAGLTWTFWYSVCYFRATNHSASSKDRCVPSMTYWLTYDARLMLFMLLAFRISFPDVLVCWILSCSCFRFFRICRFYEFIFGLCPSFNISLFHWWVFLILISVDDEEEMVCVDSW